MTGDAVVQRLHRLRDAAVLLSRHGHADVVAAADVDGLLARSTARLRHGADATVAALVGTTGSGKSSLLNAVAGEAVARTGVTRPTTAVAQAVTFGAGADALLDDLGITRRHHVAAPPPAPGGAAPSLHGLVLLDLPDFDSVTSAHRSEVDRLVRLVDLMVWVTDPQKYADESLHAGYLRRLSGHGDVMRVVLNKADLLDPAALGACLADLRRLLADDGLPQVEPLAVSAAAAGGAAPLRELLAAEVAARRAAVHRIAADVDTAVAALRAAAGPPGRTDLSAVRTRLADDLAAAAGASHVAGLVGAQHRRDAALATGWPLVRGLRRLRRAPLAALPVAAESQVARAEVSRSLRAVGGDVAERVGPGWADAVVAVTRDAVDRVAEALDTSTSREVQGRRRPPAWWRAVGWLQVLLVVVALAGGAWLAALVFGRGLLLIDVQELTPRVGAVPVPTLLLLGGLAAGLVVALLAGLAARVGAARRARAVAAALRQHAGAVADQQVLDPLELVLSDARDASDLLDQAARRT
jgi:energy-coupling factor transporter ATP-binding protein EcfA2